MPVERPNVPCDLAALLNRVGVDDAGREGWFILASGCGSPRDCTSENMIAADIAGIDYWMR